jgi:DNA-binding winged helix-turn-helix (wHTH) protein/tetratricopeptide (TPR) repeat protein
MSLTVNMLYRFDEFDLDPAQRSLTRNGSVVSLSPKAFEVLRYLVANPGRVVTKEELLQAVWPDSFVEESNLPGYISSLRKALTDRSSYIATIPGHGYQFTARVRTEEPPDPKPETPRLDPPPQRFSNLRESTHIIIRDLTSPAAAIAPPKPKRRQWIFWASLAVLAVVAAASYIVYRRSQPVDLSKVVVGDFLNLTGDPAFDSTLKSGLEVSLAQSPYIQLMGAAEVHSALSMMQKPPDSPLLGDTALDVCRRRNYQALLRGKIMPGDKWGSDALSLEVVNCATGKTVAVLRGDAANKDAVLSTLDGLAARARRKIGESNQSVAQFDVPISDATTFSFEALQAYNTGAILGNQGKIQECIPYFQKAIEIDPKFAMAQSNLGTAYANLGDGLRAGDYARAAFDVSGGVSQWEKFYIRNNYYTMTFHDLENAETNLKDWTRVYPRDETSWGALGYVETVIGNLPAATQADEHAQQMSALKPEFEYVNLADLYMRQGRYADSKRKIAEAMAQGKDGPALHMLLLDMAFVEHDARAMQAEIQWASTQPQLYKVLEIQALMAADLGKAAESEALFDRAVVDGVKEVGPAYADALRLDETGVEAALGRMAKARELLGPIKNHDNVNWAIASTKAGSTTSATAYTRLPKLYPRDTLLNKAFIPELGALLALRRNDPAGAIALLEPGRPYELALPEIIDARGQAYLAAKQGVQAEAEFRKLIDHPSLEEPTMPRTFLAHLGLARAYALQGHKDESRKEYETFFDLWKDADADSPVLRQAHLEAAQQGWVAPTPPTTNDER